MNDDCIFCKIAAGQIPATVLHRDERVIAIADVHPQAPQHALVMPVKHSATLPELVRDEDATTVAHLFRVAAQLGAQNENGFRIVVNTGPDGGQTVDHVHVHVLAQRQLHWPPG